MKIFLSGLIILIISAAALAQNPKKLIVWSGDAHCGVKSRAVDKLDTIYCDSIKTERGQVSTISYDDVTLAVAFLEAGDRYIVAAQINNDTDEVIGFDSDLWGAAHFKNRDDFVKRKRPLLAETSIPSRDIIRRMAKGTELENSLGDFMGEMQVVGETRDLRRSDGTRVKTTVIVPDKAAIADADRVEANRTEMLTKEQRRLRRNALTEKFVRSHDSVKGLVYFRRLDDAEFVAYSLKVADTTFVFLLPWAKQ